MPKLKVPLLSFDARGNLAKLFAFTKRRGQHIIEALPTPTDAKSPNQLFYRHMFGKCADLWHTLSEAEKQAWESLARPRHMTGYAFWISSCLRPNPGIYLPLQGGTMSGDIDMDKNRLLKLPLPSDSQEPLTLAYHIANIAPYLYNEGARVYHSADQVIPHATWTTLAFDSERHDTNNIHDPITNNARLTCRTAGRYLIVANVSLVTNAVGTRALALHHSVGGYIAESRVGGNGASHIRLAIATIYHFDVNDYVKADIYQTSGAPLVCNVAEHLSIEFMMERIGK